jgi:hypothetical protein
MGTGGGWLTRFRRRAPALLLTLGFWLAAEALAALLLPTLVPPPVALSWYLGAEARDATRRFLGDRHPFLMYDSLTGWRNRPGCRQDTWWIDSLGSRSTHPLGWQKTRPRRLLFLGSSLVNGGFQVGPQETISAFCEDSLAEAGNFATMLYSLDQMVLAYTGGLYRFGADVVIVGVPEQPGNGLMSRYLPYFQRSQVRMPCFKPRFVEEGDSLRLVPVPSLGRWQQMLTSTAVLDSLGRDDGYLGEFESYRRFGLMPLSAGLREAITRAHHLSRLLRGHREALPLAIRLMRELVAEAGRRQARVIFVMLPQREEAFPSGWRRRLPDHHAATVKGLRQQGLVVLDGRDVLRTSGLPPLRLFTADGKHFMPAANRALADGLRGLMGPVEMPAGAPALLAKRTSPPPPATTPGPPR